MGTDVEYVSVLHFLNDSMLLNLSTAPQPTRTIDLDPLDPIEVIELMIDLRIQFGQIEQQLKDLKPAFMRLVQRSVPQRLNEIAQS